MKKAFALCLLAICLFLVAGFVFVCSNHSADNRPGGDYDTATLTVISPSVPDADNHEGDVCPKCKSTNVAEIVYGLPAPGEKAHGLDEAVDSGKVILGGCVINDESPKYRCNDCKHEWGRFEP